MEPVPPDSSPLYLPRGEIVYYPTARPSIRVLTQQIAALGYEVTEFPLQETDLRQLPTGVWHRAVVIAGYIIFIVDPGEVLLIVGQEERSAQSSASRTSGYGSFAEPEGHNSDNPDPSEDGYGYSNEFGDWDSDNVDPDHPEDGYVSSLP